MSLSDEAISQIVTYTVLMLGFILDVVRSCKCVVCKLCCCACVRDVKPDETTRINENPILPITYTIQ